MAQDSWTTTGPSGPPVVDLVAVWLLAVDRKVVPGRVWRLRRVDLLQPGLAVVKLANPALGR